MDLASAKGRAALSALKRPSEHRRTRDAPTLAPLLDSFRRHIKANPRDVRQIHVLSSKRMQPGRPGNGPAPSWAAR